jgi:acyl-[acyl-carrier-protein]-phospholipid O-acyltransferase/long-chain-fatty-acid--[acyl-carrier-protein] ligase
MGFDQQLASQIKQGRSKFIAMAVTYFLGAFNDNFFKQAALLLAVSAGLNQLQGTATILFALPFILFSAGAGWLADRYSKKYVVIGVKLLELVAMLIGAWGMITLNWNGILAMVFIMALQSTLFGPAINGSIPELYPYEYVTKANALLKLVTTLAILMGIAFAGFAIDQGNSETLYQAGRTLVAGVVITVSAIGVLFSFGVVKRPAQGTTAPFPWFGPLNSAKDLYHLRQDKPLFLALLGDAFFYFMASLVVLIINTLGIQQLHYSSTVTSLLIVALMVGICVGSFLAAKWTSVDRWTHILAPASCGLGLGLVLCGLTPQLPEAFQLPTLIVALVISGCCGGVFIIPQSSFIQVRPAAHERGKVIAVSNFGAFTGILISGQLFAWLDLTTTPAVAMCVGGGLTLGVALVFKMILKKEAWRV